jgi:hypothetical protein
LLQTFAAAFFVIKPPEISGQLLRRFFSVENYLKLVDSKTFAAAKNRRESQHYILAAALNRRNRIHIKQKKY